MQRDASTLCRQKNNLKSNDFKHLQCEIDFHTSKSPDNNFNVLSVIKVSVQHVQNIGAAFLISTVPRTPYSQYPPLGTVSHPES